MINISDRVAFITGGANGIGLGIAKSLAKKGAKLALVDIDAAALERAKEQFGANTQIYTGVLDVQDRNAYENIANEAEAALGSVSILVNNAGVACGAHPIKLTYELWDWGLGINLGGVINGIQTFLPRMIKNGHGGHIVNTASGAGLVTSGGGGVLYCTSKFAVVGLSEAIRGELEPYGIGVSVLCPGPVATKIVSNTMKMQPKGAVKFSQEQIDKALQRQKEVENYLANGVSPDAVGDMVLNAIQKNSLYIHTDRAVAQMVEARTKAILEAMP